MSTEAPVYSSLTMRPDSIIIVITIIINEYPEAGLAASISVQHIYYKHELQQELY